MKTTKYTDAVAAEADDDSRLRKSKEAVEYCRQSEITAIRALANARDSLACARRKHITLFQKCEKRAVDRRKAGLVKGSTGH